MRRLPWLLAVCLAAPASAHALQLHWKSGASDLGATAAVRCTLVVAADSGQVLPQPWYLDWAATDSVGLVDVDSSSACGQSTAQAELIPGPQTEADTLAWFSHGYYCSTAPSSPTSAQIIVDLPANSRGSFKVVALNEAGYVAQSGLATFNGGCSSPFPPTILRATKTHIGYHVSIAVLGANLSGVTAAQIGATDNLWDVALDVSSVTDSTFFASGSVSALLPACVLLGSTAAGLAGEADLAAEDETAATVAASGTPDTILYVDPNPKVYPKDFAFYYNSYVDLQSGTRKAIFHLFYIRNYAPTAADSIIAHAWCDTLGGSWKVDTLAFRPSGIGWDKKKVWAPSIQQVGTRTYMFYTGVDSLGNQSIGYTYTDADLGTYSIPWQRQRSPIYTPANTGWADQIGTQVPGVRQFRDAFIMTDPDHSGRYLLINAGEDKNFAGHYTIGVARNVAGSVDSWTDLGNYAATDHSHMPFITGALEAPLMVRDSLTGAWRMFVAFADYQVYNSTYFRTEAVGDSVTDTRASSWPGLDSLYYYLGGDNNVVGWEACEHLQIGQVHFFAAYNGGGIGITRMHWDPVSQKFFFVHPTNAGVGPGVAPTGVSFSISELRGGAGVVRFSINSPTTIAPRLVVYDLTGREVREVASGQSMHGRRELLWNCRDRTGQRVPTGMYFARLTNVGAAQTLRVPIVR